MYAGGDGQCASREVAPTREVRGMTLVELGKLCRSSSTWWDEVTGSGNTAWDKAVLIGLMHAELSECLEGVRTDCMDDKLPNRRMEDVEMADVIISVLAYCEEYGIDLVGALGEKLRYNKTREDHKRQNRREKKGKKF